MAVHWTVLRNLMMRPAGVRVTDDRRDYRGVELLAAALHAADAIERACRTRHVGLLLPTSGAFPIAALGAWLAGRVIVPLNYLLKPDELQYVVDDCETDTVVTVGPMLDHLGTAPRVRRLLRLEDIDFRSVPPARWPASAEPGDLACLLYTSGTSGHPKGVMLTHANLAANIAQIRRWIRLSKRDTLLGVLPQFHSFGLTVLTLLPLAVGPRIVYTARFVPHQIVKLFRAHRPSMFVGIPSMYGALLTVKDAGPEDFASLRLAVSGGEPLPDDVSRRFQERFGVTIAEGYGMTECSPVTNWCRPFEYRPHSVGRALPEIEQWIVDPATDRELGTGVDGELRITGPNVMKGYFKLQEETAGAFDRRGRLRTGDMARVDDDGHLFITGRIKEMLIVGGENVFPREIEEAICTHPAVHAAGVVGQHDPVRGETPVAFVELEDGRSVDERELIVHCRERLAGFKVPRRVIFLDAMPRNPTGKVLRRALRDELARIDPASAGA